MAPLGAKNTFSTMKSKSRWLDHNSMLSVAIRASVIIGVPYLGYSPDLASLQVNEAYVLFFIATNIYTKANKLLCALLKILCVCI